MFGLVIDGYNREPIKLLKIEDSMNLDPSLGCNFIPWTDGVLTGLQPLSENFFNKSDANFLWEMNMPFRCLRVETVDFF